MKKLLIILAVVLLPTIAFANFSIQFENTFNKKMFYLLYWIDHTFDWPQPVNLAGGELDALESIDLSSNYRQGKYVVIWTDEDSWQNKVFMKVRKNVTSVKVTPNKSSILIEE
jgi:hypothetical protein